jgi:5-methylcytosine-specific restriction endonuclease McrA
MRQLTKTEPPDVLRANENAWSQAFVDHVTANGGVVGPGAPVHYRHDDIREGLRVETIGKCAYCESKITHISYVHIEHILPKSKRPELVVSWENLTLACELCNQAKGDYYDPANPIAHPYTDDPELHISFEGPLARTDGHGTGHTTIVHCDLNRGDLLLERAAVLEHVEQLLRQAQLLSNPGAKRTVLAEAWALADEDAEYASMVRRYLEARTGGPRPA